MKAYTEKELSNFIDIAEGDSYLEDSSKKILLRNLVIRKNYLTPLVNELESKGMKLKNVSNSLAYEFYIISNLIEIFEYDLDN